MEIIKELLSKPLEKLSGGLTNEINQMIFNRLLEYQIEEYKRSFHTKTILHRTAPVRLYDIYQPLYIRRFGKNYKDERSSTESVLNIFKDSNLVTLLGTAGSGKSTIVKFLIIQCIEEKYKTPIKIELRYLNKYQGGLFDYIEKEIFNRQQLAFEKSTLNRLLHSGDFVFFLDGYDELSSNVKEKITKDINDFTKLYNTNDFLLTSRPYTNIELLSKFHNYEVCEMNEYEIEQFIRKQLSKNEEDEIASKILESIKANSENSPYQTFLSNPLLLSMFILTFQNYSNVPPKKSTFYRQVFDSLYHLHDSMSKLAYEREKKSGLSKDQFETVLKLFSYISFFKQIFVFDGQFLNETLNQIKSAKKELVFDNEDFIDDLQIAICIFQKEGLDYVFPHRSLQEYFASLYIIGLLPDQKKEVYGRMLQQFIDIDILELLTKDNFFSLLIEHDELGVVKDISLPFLENCNRLIKSNEPIQKKELAISSLFFFIYSFHQKNDIFKDILESLYKYNEEKAKIFRRYQFIEKTIKLSTEDQLEIAELSSNQIKFLKIQLPKTIRDLRTYIKEATESDNLIINLI